MEQCLKSDLGSRVVCRIQLGLLGSDSIYDSGRGKFGDIQGIGRGVLSEYFSDPLP